MYKYIIHIKYDNTSFLDFDLYNIFVTCIYTILV